MLVEDRCEQCGESHPLKSNIPCSPSVANSDGLTPGHRDVVDSLESPYPFWHRSSTWDKL